jgi:hypothetical protein
MKKKVVRVCGENFSNFVITKKIPARKRQRGARAHDDDDDDDDAHRFLLAGLDQSSAAATKAKE